MNFEQWWATLTIKEQTYIGKGTAKFVWSCAIEECAKLDQTLALSPSLFATVAEYNAYKQGVMAYRVAIRARGSE